MNRTRGLSLLLAGLMLLALAGCSAPANTQAPAETAPAPVETAPVETPAPAPAKLTPGTYEGEAQGMIAPLKVAVTVSEDAILSIEVLESKDTQGVGEYAYSNLPPRMVEAQTTGVDIISGATVSSRALQFACNNALEKAGGDNSAFTAQVDQPAKEQITLDADVVVVGAGMSGYSAAIGALEAGADTILLERLSIVGGSSAYSGSAMMAAGTKYNPEAASQLDEMIEWIYQRYESYTRRDLLEYVFNNAADVVNWISDMGIEFTLGAGGNSNLIEGGGREWSHRNKVSGCRGTIAAMNERADELGLKLYVDTLATDMIVDGSGRVTGVIAEGPDAVYTINAKGGVVLCTGGYEGNDELFKQYATYSEREVRGTAGKSSAAGDQGDVFKFAQQVGADIAVTGYGLAGYPEIQTSATMTKMFKTRTNGRVDLTDSMTRYHDEVYGGYEQFKWDMIKADSYYFYTLFDSTELPENVLTNLEEGVTNGYIYKADTLEELATQLKADGLDGNRMLVSVAEYNDFCLEGMDKAFGRDSGTMTPIVTGPFYLGTDREVITGCWGGVKINANAEVLSTSGAPIPGLYAAGECAGGEFFYRDYVCGGTCLSFCAVMGRTGGALAAGNAK